MDKELNILQGTHIWKSGLEYHNEHTVLHGFPYYQITEVDGVYYLWALDWDKADDRKYNIIKQTTEFSPLHEEGMALNNALGNKYRERELYYLQGKELIAKLRDE